MNAITRQKTFFEQCPSLVEKMKSLGLMSVIPQRPIEGTKEIQAAKAGMTYQDYNRHTYQQRKAKHQGLRP